MRKFFIIPYLWVCFSLSACSQTAENTSTPDFALIPQPVSLKQADGGFTILSGLNIIAPKNDEVKRLANQLAERIKTVTGLDVTVNEGFNATSNSIFISLEKGIPHEGYKLAVSNDQAHLTASTPAGIFYGIQTLYQLLPKEIMSATAVSREWVIPTVTIEDHPRFEWRGLMLDVTRHFFTVDEVKDFIDNMARYKFNMLHLHLSDDQGWRLQIKSLPKLTEVGAWRVEKTGTFGTFTPPSPDEPKNYGGFYTHEDIKELVRYASDRFINILPEIDVPGHSLAAVASYPELSCTPGEYRVNSGERFMIWPPGGHFYGTLDNFHDLATRRTFLRHT